MHSISNNVSCLVTGDFLSRDPRKCVIIKCVHGGIIGFSISAASWEVVQGFP